MKYYPFPCLGPNKDKNALYQNSANRLAFQNFDHLHFLHKNLSPRLSGEKRGLTSEKKSSQHTLGGEQLGEF